VLAKGLTGADSVQAKENDWHGIDTTSIEPNKVSPWISKNVNGEAVDSSFHVYLRRGEDNQLVFTVKTDSTGDPANDWTNGEPTKFRYGGKKTDGTYSTKYYYANPLWGNALRGILEHFIGINEDESSHWNENYTFGSIYKPDSNHIARYVYKNKDDSWRPLYIRLEEVPEEKPAKYVGWD
jgi:hypothetical protein